MKSILLPALTAGFLTTAAAQQPAAPAGPKTAAESQKAFTESFPEKPAPKLPPGLRARGFGSATLTRSGLVPRGVLQVLVTPEVAKIADKTGRLPRQPEAPAASEAPAPPPPPAAVTSDQIKKAETAPAEFRVDPAVTASFSSITFEFDSATVTAGGLEVIRGIADGMKQRPAYRFLVEGHTCERGEENYNDRLSTLRAAVVCAWLRHYGVPDRQLQPLGCGERHPLPLPTESPDISRLSDKAKEPFIAPNRRVDFRPLLDPAQP